MKTVIRRGANWLSGNKAVMALRRKVMVGFAKKHGLTYFWKVNPDGYELPVLQGSTLWPEHSDRNYCIGSHAGYDVTLVERTAKVSFENYSTTYHRWYVLQIDLKDARMMPYIFVGTPQQTKAYYARILVLRHYLQHLMIDTESVRSAAFHSHYVVLASPSEVRTVATLFDTITVDAMAAHLYPFAVEIDGDNIIVSTEAHKPSPQLLEKLLHYGLWLAKEIDRKFT